MRKYSKIDAACEMCGVERATMYKWVQSNFVPHIRIGGPRGRIRFDLDELQEWLESQKTPGRLERVPQLEV